MANDVPGSTSDLSWLLADLMRRVPHTRCALLASSDGLRRYHHGLDSDEADALAAWAAAQCSLARNAGHRFGAGGGVRQVVAEFDDIIFFVSAAGPGAVLVVLATPEADAAVLGYEIAQLVKRVPSHLTTASRQPTAARSAGDLGR
ncbi:roadblock/LC7 domain-containing protein [Saccharopolyspora oryzae]|uniref:Roadblock/LC7 domain-containing protein n=1 Tax=Saccharopolyspora oryzae TaxID=2997343 RepID=A0ABT4V424_9PSEU|nr:roadblock/LC7 domain-containing protein [Saccharopolyspora oryzae]MDA3628721.1 roadblock/LC7 domain-containing protein [Saccharopolyspora oryzae]